MNLNKLFIISIISCAAICLSLPAVAGDINLNPDGTVPGKPFEYLQQQINDLQDQIDNIQAGIVKAYFTSDGDIIIDAEGVFVKVLGLELPRGAYVSNMTLSVASMPRSDNSFLDCRFINEDTNSQITGGFGLVVNHPQQLAHTWSFNVFADSANIALYCRAWGFEDWEISTIHHAEWSVIEVDEIDNQSPQ